MSLEELCKKAGLPWLDRASSQLEREIFKSIPRRHEGLREDLLELMLLCRDARDFAHPQGRERGDLPYIHSTIPPSPSITSLSLTPITSPPPLPSPPPISAVEETVKKLPAVDSVHGTLSFPTSTYQSLNPAIARRALGHWIRYIGGVSDVRFDLIVAMHRFLTSPDNRTNLTGSNILMTLDPERKRSTISRRSPDTKYRSRVPIRVGETILWDNRFKISLIPRRSARDTPSRDQPTHSEDSSTYYVRHLVEKDWPYMSKGAVRYKVPVNVRGGLPVVVNEQNKIVLMPHFKVASRDARVLAVVKFKPVRSIEDLLQYSHYHEC